MPDWYFFSGGRLGSVTFEIISASFGLLSCSLPEYVTTTFLQDLGVGGSYCCSQVFPNSQESKASKQSPEIAERWNQEIRA